MSESDTSPDFAPFFGMGGIAFAMIFGCAGAAYGTAKAGIGIAGVGTFRPDLIMKVCMQCPTRHARLYVSLMMAIQSLIPVVMAGIIAVYSLVIAVLIAGAMEPSKKYSLFNGFLHLAAGLSVGLTGLAAGYAIGIVGDSVRPDAASCPLKDRIDSRKGVRAYMQQSRIFVGMVLILIFGEVLGLYGYASRLPSGLLVRWSIAN
ncbi:MAG: hypothetical protein Q9224_001574 [Gallowayella concinna]